MSCFCELFTIQEMQRERKGGGRLTWVRGADSEGWESQRGLKKRWIKLREKRGKERDEVGERAEEYRELEAPCTPRGPGYGVFLVHP